MTVETSVAPSQPATLTETSPRLRGGALELAGARAAVPGDDAGHVRAVAEVVEAVALARQVDLRDDARAEVRGRRDAGVDARDRDALALVLVRHAVEPDRALPGRLRGQRVVAGRVARCSRGRCASPHGRRSRRPRRKRRGAGPGRRSLGTRAAKPPRAEAGVRRSRRAAARRARRRREDGERSTTTTCADAGRREACAGAALTRSAAASATTAAARRERRTSAGGDRPRLAGGRHATSG